MCKISKPVSPPPPPPPPVVCKPVKPPVVDCKPVLPPPVDCKPVLPPPVDCKPVLPPPVDCKPVLPPPVDCKPVLPPPVDCKPVLPPPVDCKPVLPPPVDCKPYNPFPMPKVIYDCKPIVSKPVDCHPSHGSKFSDWGKSDWTRGHGCVDQKFSNWGKNDWARNDCFVEQKFSNWGKNDWTKVNDCFIGPARGASFPRNDVSISNNGSTGSVEFGKYQFKFDQNDATWSMTDKTTGETTKVWGDPHITNPNGKTVTTYGDYTFKLDNGITVSLKTVNNNDKEINARGFQTSHGVTPQESWSETVVISDGHRTVVVDNVYRESGNHQGLSMKECRGGTDAAINTTWLAYSRAGRMWVEA